MARFEAPFRAKALRLTLWASALAWVTGCASAPTPGSDDEPQRELRAPIVGGYLDTTTHGVVALALRSKTQVEVFCSGSLLAPNLVLTARHCIAQIGNGSSEQVDCAVSKFTAEYDPSGIFVSTDAQPQQSMGKLYSVQQILEAPGSTAVCGFDIALLVLKGPGIPGATATPIVPVLSTPTLEQTVFSAVGYGLQNPKDKQGSTAGKRMRFDSAGVYCVGQSCPDAAQNEADEWVGNSPVCSGDSGGPALDSKGRVFGVTSRGDDACSYALYSNVANWADFIRSTARAAAAAGGYTAPSWASTDSTGPLLDSGVNQPVPDAGVSEPDAGVSEPDAGVSEPDAGVTEPDAGSGAGGSSSSAKDAGTTAMTPPPVGMTPTVSPLGQACSGNCPGIYQCYAASGMPPGICVPPCAASGASCPADYTCATSPRVCVPAKDITGKANLSASCALSTTGAARGAHGWLLLFVLGCAWLARRQKTAS